MTRSVQLSDIHGTILAPASKSMMQRAVAVATLGSVPCRIENISPCDDLYASIRAARSLGAEIEEMDDVLRLSPAKNELSDVVQCGEAGLTVRMFSPIASLFDHTFEFRGEGSLLKRPVTMVEEALTGAAVSCMTSKGFLPMTIRGPLQGGELAVDGSLSSQLLTGLLVALPFAPNDSHITVDNLKSIPYIDMTLEVLDAFGIVVENRNYTDFIIKGGQKSSIDRYQVEGDWSGASFPLVAAALAGEVTVSNLRADSLQADKKIVEVLEMCGAEIMWKGDSITVSKKGLKSFEFDASHCPDLFPPLVALAAGLDGESVIYGAHRLTHKESNRALVLIEEFAKVGVAVAQKDDALVVTGGTIAGGTAHSNNDHRIAMALAVAGVISENGVTILEPDAINKSYPKFYDDLLSLGGIVL